MRISNLKVKHGVIEALAGVDLEVQPGEIVTLIGSNGAGKSTLLRAISGLNRACEGKILWEDKCELTRLRPDEIVGLGISHVPEGRRIFPEMTVLENLKLGGYLTSGKKEINQGIERGFDLFPILKERSSQSAGTLSGGEQQMLAIARALMIRPKLLLMDEPSLGLAPIVVQKIFAIIREIHSQGTTIFLVEQNAHMALRVAQRGYVLQTGKILFSDSADKLLDHPKVKSAYLGG